MAVIAGAFLLSVALVIRWLAPRSADLPLRTSALVLHQDAFRVYSWDRTSDRFTVVTIPTDTAVSATRGYGTYSLESLWKLDQLDRHDGRLIKESVEETLGLPIQFFIDPGDTAATEAQAAPALRSLFSFGSLLRLVRGQIRTDMPASSFSAFVFAVRGTAPENIFSLEIPDTSVLVAQNRADGSEEVIFDVQRYDAIIGTRFELIPIRNERLSVTVANTAGVPSLGTRAARLLSHLGVLVVSVGNETPLVDRCELRGKKADLSSQTAALIIRTLSCVAVPVPQTDTSDLHVRVGTEYQRRFEPAAK